MRIGMSKVVVGILIIITAIVAGNTVATTTRSGVLVRKSYTPGYWGTMLVAKVLVPHYYDESWYFYIQNCPDGQREFWPSSGCKNGAFPVTKSVFDSYQVGSSLSFGPDNNYLVRALTGFFAIFLVSIGGGCLVLVIINVEYQIVDILLGIVVFVVGLGSVILGLHFVQMALVSII